MGGRSVSINRQCRNNCPSQSAHDVLSRYQNFCLNDFAHCMCQRLDESFIVVLFFACIVLLALRYGNLVPAYCSIRIACCSSCLGTYPRTCFLLQPYALLRVSDVSECRCLICAGSCSPAKDSWVVRLRWKKK